jgi:hypothetical protein
MKLITQRAREAEAVLSIAQRGPRVLIGTKEAKDVCNTLTGRARLVGHDLRTIFNYMIEWRRGLGPAGL